MAEDITKEAKFADGTVADLHFVRSFGKGGEWENDKKLTATYGIIYVSIQIPDQTWGKLQNVNWIYILEIQSQFEL